MLLDVASMGSRELCFYIRQKSICVLEGPMQWCSERKGKVSHAVRMEECGDSCENRKYRGQHVHSPRLFQVMV